MEKNNKNDIKTESENLAIFDTKRKTESANVTIPTEKGVIDAKEWVEENEK